MTNAEIVAKVDVSESNKVFNVDQIADFEKVIPLDTVGDALVGEIDKLEMDDNHIVILDKRMRTVWLFGIDGKFIRRIGMVQRNMSREEYEALVGSGCDGRFESDFGVVQAEISYRMVF